MFTYNGRDAHRPITPARINLPYKAAIADILPERRKTEDDEADPALQRLPAPGLKGTWARAYALLTKLVSKIGWDELLRTRSAVFVMEEEYRMQKAQVDIRRVNGSVDSTESPSTGTAPPVIHEDGTVRNSVISGTSTKVEADDDASIKGVVSPESPGGLKTATPSASDLNVNEIPTIKISTEEDREREDEGKKTVTNGDETREEEAPETHGLEKPVQARAASAEDGENTEDTGPNSAQEGFSFSNKRLCERWLDNLFMVLYEASLRLNLPRRIFLCFTLGPAHMDDLPRRGCALQDTACCVPQDGVGVGNSGRPRTETAPQGGG